MGPEDQYTPPGKPPPTAGGMGSRPQGMSAGRLFKVTLWVLLLIWVVLFVLLNRASVDISFVFYTATVPVIVVILAMLLAGAVLGSGVGMLRRRRAARPKDERARAEES